MRQHPWLQADHSLVGEPSEKQQDVGGGGLQRRPRERRWKGEPRGGLRTKPCKMGTIKDRNGMNLTEAEDIRRGGKNTQKTTQKRSS